MKNKIKNLIAKGLYSVLGSPVNYTHAIGMPTNLFFVRHGQSEGNVAVQMSKDGDDSAFTEEFTERHSKTWKLTEKGIEQAKEAGQWLINNGYAKFDHYYVSPYDRTLQTAAYMGLPGANWHRPKLTLRERDRGRLDATSVQVLKNEHPDVEKGEQQDAYLYRFPGGESMADSELRARHMCTTLEREASGQDVVIVTHGEMMLSFEKLLEGFSLDEFMRRFNSHDNFDKIHNCQILQYSRIDHITGKLNNYYVSKRSICPWDLSKSSNEWKYIKREKFTNEQLLESIK